MQNAKIFLLYQEYESRQTLKNFLEEPELFFSEVQRFSASTTFSLLYPSRSLAGALGSYPRLPTRSSRTLEEAARNIFAEFMEFWSVFYYATEDRVEQGTAPDCFLSRFIGNPEIASFNEVERVTIAAELLTAGAETAGTSLQWFFKAALLYPSWLTTSQEGIDLVVGADRMPHWRDRPNLPYINAIIAELDRWASAAPLAFFHATSDADSYRGVRIPKGTTIIPNTFAIHYSNDYYARHEELIPERFLSPDDNRYLPSSAYTDSHMAFRISQRECPGRHVADDSLWIMVTRLLWGFDIKLGNNARPGDGTAGSLPALGPEPFKCKLAPRTQQVAQKIKNSASIIEPGIQVEDGSIYEEQIKHILSKYQVK